MMARRGNIEERENWLGKDGMVTNPDVVSFVRTRIPQMDGLSASDRQYNALLPDVPKPADGPAKLEAPPYTAWIKGESSVDGAVRRVGGHRGPAPRRLAARRTSRSARGAVTPGVGCACDSMRPDASWVSSAVASSSAGTTTSETVSMWWLSSFRICPIRGIGSRAT